MAGAARLQQGDEPERVGHVFREIALDADPPLENGIAIAEERGCALRES